MAPSHYLIHCWPRPMALYGISRSQRVKCSLSTLISMLTRFLCTSLINVFCRIFPFWLFDSWRNQSKILQISLSFLLQIFEFSFQLPSIILCNSQQTTIGSGNGLATYRWQDIAWYIGISTMFHGITRPQWVNLCPTEKSPPRKWLSLF